MDSVIVAALFTIGIIYRIYLARLSVIVAAFFTIWIIDRIDLALLSVSAAVFSTRPHFDCIR